jgi:putative restriction endonuclease
MDFDFVNFDMPIFKMLASNDTGEASGHQGGMVIPRAIEHFFPVLSSEVTAASPTVEKIIWAELFVGSVYLSTVNTRYQLQTWGGKRSPEYRLTNGLSALRNEARGNDVLVIQRSVTDSNLYRLTLVKQTAKLFEQISERFNGRRWGALYQDDEPVIKAVAMSEVARQESMVEQPFEMFDPVPRILERRTATIARSRAFATVVATSYQNTCSVCGFALTLPNGRSEIEASHIVPRSRAGADDVRNGLALCRSHHWAFDAGLFSITEGRTVYVPEVVLRIGANAHLARHNNQPINLPIRLERWPATEALSWHFENTLLRD